MEPRARWQALQENLRIAHERSAAGDFEAAQRYIDAALALDPGFAPAVSLKESLALPPPPAHLSPIRSAVESPSTAAAPMVSPEGWARFEERARARRVERRLVAARSALSMRQYEDAEAALNEVEELSPNHAELTELRQDLLAAQVRRGPRRHWLAIAGVAAVLLLIATQLEKYPRVFATAARDTNPSVTPRATQLPRDRRGATPAISEPIAIPDAVATTATSTPPATGFETRVPPSLTVNSRADLPKEAAPVLSPPDIPVATVPLVSERAELPSKPSVVLVPPDVRTLPLAPTATPVERPAPLERPALVERLAPTEDQLVRQVLQRYREAYTSLNARSAQDVWPSVDAPALARAFDALESQQLTFDDCRIEVAASDATATCRGSARFVPKIGGREARTEARVWNFRLQKTAAGWQIASARVGR